MFSTLHLFSEIVCPEGSRCRLPTCLFAHQEKQASSNPDRGVISRHAGQQPSAGSGSDLSPSRKRRKLESTPQDADGREVSWGLLKEPLRIQSRAEHDATASPESARRPISPPSRPNVRPPSTKPTKRQEDEAAERKDPPKNASVRPNWALGSKQETLNPRLLSSPPASHVFRLRVLTKIHEQLQRLNEEWTKSKGSSTVNQALGAQDLIVMALDEEEQIARETPSLYSNLVKNRIMIYTRMKLDEWEKLKIEPLFKESKDEPTVSKQEQNGRVVIDTGLSSSQEAAVLPRLLASRTDLEKAGYVVREPAEKDMEDARRGVDAAQGWEVCDRCKARFQVFPGRREDGCLASGGKCSYHWGKVLRPSKQEALNGHVDKRYACCNEPVGTSPGCTTAASHVFKVSEVKRLASVLQFEETPDDRGLTPPGAICMDCEMGYTTYGLELIRMTATAWPGGEEVVDTLVRPLGEILDLNSRFSGVWPADLANASPYEESPPTATSDHADRPILPIVSSPSAARALLFAHLGRRTPLIGHALENDLNATRIVHPSIVDTALLFPHRGGLPYRNSLKMLVSRHLERDIQLVDSKTGHDSREDARAAGDLVRYAVGREWKKMRRDGWALAEDGGVQPPAGRAEVSVKKRGDDPGDG